MTETAPAVKSTSDDETLQQAFAAYRDGKLADAETLCRRVLERQPNHLAGLQLLAAIAGQLGVPHRGIELLEKVVELQPHSADARIRLAKLLRQDGRVPEALAALDKAIELQPDSAGAYIDLGVIHLAELADDKALACFTRASEISPDLVIGHFNTGLALERQGRNGEAVAAYRRAIAIAPDFAPAHVKLGSLLLHDGERHEALDCFRRAAAAQPGTAMASLCEARLLIEEEKAAAAEAPARRAIELDSANSDAHCLLGMILMLLGRFREAAAAYDLGLALNRGQIGAYHELAHVKKLTEADRPLIAEMEWLLKERRLPEEAQADLHFALGKAYDDLRDYQSAIRHIDDANRLKRPVVGPYQAAGHTAGIDRQIRTFTADFFARNALLGSDSERPILIVGMPRSGTTLVEQILSSHPAVAAGGELPFWGEQSDEFRINRLREVHPAWIERAARDYLATLSEISPTAARVTDKRPQNFHYLALAHAVFPRARIIHCRRHPIDTCLSIYFQNFARRIDFAYDRDDLVAFYRQYLRLMAHWRSVLPTDRFCEVQYEELVADPEPVTREIIAFCGLEWDDTCLHSERNQRAVRTASVWQARQPIYRTSVARWQRYEPWLGSLRDLLSDVDQATSQRRSTVS